MLEPNVAKSKGRRDDLTGRVAFLTIFLILVAVVWVLLFTWNVEHRGTAVGINRPAAYLFLNPSHLASFCWSSTSQVGIWTTVAMWGVMSTGMMLPTAAPFISTYFKLTASQPLRISASNIWGLVGGYVAVWLVFSIGAGLVQRELARAGLLSAHGISISTPL